MSDDDPPTKDASTQTIPVVITYPTDATEISDTELWDEENYTEEYWSDAREYEDAEEEMLEVDEEFEHEEEPPSPEEVCPPWKTKTSPRAPWKRALWIRPLRPHGLW